MHDFAEAFPTPEARPASVMPRLAAALQFHAPDAHARIAPVIAAIPAEALASGSHAYWEVDGAELIDAIFVALEEAEATWAMVPAPANDCELVIRCASCGCSSTDSLGGRDGWRLRRTSGVSTDHVCPECAPHG